MRAALANMRRHTLATEAGRSADREFHDAVLQATRNDALVTLSASIGAAVNWTTHVQAADPALPRDPIPDHARVSDAIAAAIRTLRKRRCVPLIDLALEDTRYAMAATRWRPTAIAGNATPKRGPLRRVRNHARPASAS
jgi:DNA-binding FadR family transcriptional regulator